MLRVLAITNMYPSTETPTLGTFVEQQVLGLRKIGVEVDVLYINRAHEGVRSYFKLKKLIATKVNSFQPNIVHSMYGGILSKFVCEAVKSLPVVVSFCGSDLFGAYTKNPLIKIMGQFGVYSSKWSAKRASSIILKSEVMNKILPSELNSENIWILPNGIDLDLFTPLDKKNCKQLLGWDVNCFNILFPSHSGRPVKRIELAIAAVELLKKTGSICKLHTMKNIAPKDVPIWLNAADVLILTSAHEGSPNIIKEALACNLPIVSVKVGDVHERLEGVEGCYLSNSLPIDLMNNLKLVEEGNRIVKGREKITSLSIESVASELTKIYYNSINRYTINHS